MTRIRINIPNATYFVTKSIFKKTAVFGNKQCAQIFINALTNLESKKHKATIHSYVLMPNHYHLLITLEKADNLSKFLHSLNSCTGHQIAKVIGKSPVWEVNTWDEVIRNDDMFQQKLAYILLNPWRRQLVQSPFAFYEYSNIKTIMEKKGQQYVEGLFSKYKRFGE